MSRQSWQGVVIHATDGPDSDRLEMDDVRDYHKGIGWSDIGYHFVVEMVEGEAVVLMGRPFNRPGAHCRGWNDRMLGVALVGKFTATPPPPAQLVEAARIVAALLDQHGLARSAVYQHKAMAGNNTDCPGAAFPWAQFQAMVGGA